MRRAPWIWGLLLFACSESHGPGGVDAGPHAMDAPAEDAGPDAAGPSLAPRCASPPPACVGVGTQTTLAVSDIGEFTLSLAPSPRGPVVLFTALDTVSDAFPARAQVQRLTGTGAPLGEPILLSGTRYQAAGVDASGDLIALPDGSVLSAFSFPRYSEIPAYEGSDAFVYRIVEDGALPVAGPMQTAEVGEDECCLFADAALAVVEGAAWVVSATREGVVASPISDPAREIRVTMELSGGRLRAVAMGPELIVAWSHRPEGISGFETRVARIDTRTGELSASTVFEGRPETFWDADLLVSRSSIFVARFEREPDDLRASRIRVARLDAALRRVEPDRWLDGWGGLGPGGIALVDWQDGPWVVWQAIDARYGAPVLFAAPLSSDPCGYAVETPLSILPPRSPFANPTVFAAADGDTLWIAAGDVQGPGTIDVYSASSCAD